MKLKNELVQQEYITTVYRCCNTQNTVLTLLRSLQATSIKLFVFYLLINGHLNAFRKY